MNKPTLGGTLMMYNPESQDYSWKEAIACLKAFCDEIIILDCGSTDGSQKMLKQFEDSKTKIVCLDGSEWNKLRGKEKLSHFTNYAIQMLSTDWDFNIQCDECLHEDSFKYVREAIEDENEDAYFVYRVNLWCNSNYELNVPPERLPVGNRIIRLARTQYRSIGDAEGIYANASFKYMNRLRLYHTGFIRSKFIHTKKIEHMLLSVFGHNDLDPKIIAMNGVFDPFAYFSKEDLVPIGEPLPKYIEKWARERDEINSFEI